MKGIQITALACAALLSLCSPAYAIFNINTADIVERKLILESRNRLDEDDRPSKDGFQANALRFSYGLTPYMTLESGILVQKAPRRDYSYTLSNIETKFRFYNPGDYWLDSALKLGYERHADGRADQLQTRFIVQKTLGNWTHILNVNLAKEVGRYTEKDLQINTGWRTQYTINRYIEPGIEYYANFGELTDMPHYNGQAHRIGPMFFGEILPDIKYQAGYLFGVSDAAEDGSFKLFLRYEFKL